MFEQAHTLQCVPMMQLGSSKSGPKTSTARHSCLRQFLDQPLGAREITHPMAVYVIRNIPIDCGQNVRWKCASS